MLGAERWAVRAQDRGVAHPTPCGESLLPDQRQPGHPVGPRALGTWGWGGSTGDLQLLPIRVKSEGPHQPAERGSVLHALHQLL